MLIKAQVFGQRFCTHCETNKMYYYTINGQPEGLCQHCGNMDFCDNEETKEQVKQYFGGDLKDADIDILIFKGEENKYD